MVTVNDGFSWVPPRVSRERWLSEFAGTPAESDAAACWDAVNKWHVDPAFVLGIWVHESNKSTNPQSVNTRYGNRNPGNIRNPPPEGDTVETDRGRFLRFDTWVQGFDAMGEHLNSDLYRGLTIADAIAKYAPAGDGNDPQRYAAGVVDYMNTLVDTGTTGDGGMIGDPPPSTPPVKDSTMRVILSAGHENIGAISGDKIGITSAANLRGGTGSLGTEATGNIAVRDAAAGILRDAGVDVATTDAIYHPDVYDQDADLCVFLHHDGVGFGSDHPQWSGAAVVHSGPSTTDADDRAQGFVDAWNRISPQVTGIADTHLSDNPTVGMTQYYGGWYRTANTPAVLVESSIWGGSDGQRTDVDTNKEGYAVARATLEYLGIGGNNGTGSDTEPRGGDSTAIDGTTGNADGGTGGAGTNVGTATDQGTGTGGGNEPDATFGDGNVVASQHDRDGDGRGITIRYPGGTAAGYRVGHGFYDEYAPDGNLNAGYERYGVPRSGEFAVAIPGTQSVNGGNVVTIQVFDKGILMYDGERVTAMNTGTMAARYLLDRGVTLPADMTF